MAPPQWAYQLENFVTKPDEELVCSVCHCVFCNPVMSPCDHVFCRACITKWLQNKSSCPICRKRVPKYSIKEIVPIVKNLIMKLTLYCVNKDVGCEAQFSLESCESHMKECHFELLPCKNKPCKEKLFRKDLEKHETKDCPHRCIKCPSCGSKMSLQVDEEAHDCLTSLQLRLKRKNVLLKKKNERIRKLKEELDKLKEASAVASQSAVSSDFSPDRIRINIMESVSSDSDSSSDSYNFAIPSSDSDSSDDNETGPFEEFIASLGGNQLENTIDLSESRDSQRDDENGSVSNDANNSPAENDAEQGQSSGGSDSLPRIRPHKRRLPIQCSSSEDEQNAEERQSWSSPKRQWRSSSDHGNSASEAAGRSSANRGTEQGNPSSSFNEERRASGDEDSALNAGLDSSADQSARTTQQQISRRRRPNVSRASRRRAVFENTLALLEQYNLESDPEWMPHMASHRGDTPSPTESESSFDEFGFQSGSYSSSSSSED